MAWRPCERAVRSAGRLDRVEDCCEGWEAACEERKGPDAVSRAGAGRIRSRILVLYGMGGVGKSTVAVNLAMGCAFEGLRTGLLDVDLRGPSVPRALGLEREVLQAEGQDLLPVEMGGLEIMSMGFALKVEEAAIWRGPRKAGVVSFPCTGNVRASFCLPEWRDDPRRSPPECGPP